MFSQSSFASCSCMSRHDMCAPQVLFWGLHYGLLLSIIVLADETPASCALGFFREARFEEANKHMRRHEIYSLFSLVVILFQAIIRGDRRCLILVFLWLVFALCSRKGFQI